MAQSLMIDTCKDAGFIEAQMLSEEHALPASGLESLAVATDDINHFVPLSDQDLDELEEPPLSTLDEVWTELGLIGHLGKTQNLVDSGKVLGVQFRDGTRLQARGQKVWALVECAIDVCCHRRSTPRQMQCYSGHLQWNT